MITSGTMGSSEIYRVLNEAQYGKGCRREWAYEKLGYLPDFVSHDEDALYQRGQDLEPVAATIFSRKTGWRVRKVKTKIHPKFKWARASTDRTITGDAYRQGTGDLELKTRAEGAFYRVMREGALPGDLLQVQWSMWVSGHKWGALGVLGVASELPFWFQEFKPDKNLQRIFETECRQVAAQVFDLHQLPPHPFPATDPRCKVCVYRLQCRGEEADPDEVATQKQIEKSAKNLVQIDNRELATTLSDLELMKKEAKALEAALDLCKERVLTTLGEIDGAIVKGFGKVYKTKIVRTYFNSKRLQADNPELYQQYLSHYVGSNYSLKTYPAKAMK